MAADPSAQGCIQHAGILDENEVLTPTAKSKIIERIKNAGSLGFSATSPFPCEFGSKIQPAVGLVPDDLEDETKYPEFHADIIATYEKVAKGFNINVSPNLPFPFCDPTALALKLGLNLPEFDFANLPTLTPPALALTLGLKIPQIPDLQAAFNIPPAIPLPDFGFPTLNVDINLPPKFSQKFDFDNWAIKMPNIFLNFSLDLLTKLDFPGLIDLSLGKPCPIIDTIAKSQAFGPNEEGDVVKQIVIADLVVFSGQCASITTVGVLAGTSPVGATGGIGTKFGYKEAAPVTGNGADVKARNVVIEAYKQVFGKNPTLAEAQFVQTIAKLENSYGTAFYEFYLADDPKNPGKQIKKAKIIQGASNGHNWGNIHGKGPAGSFTGVDYDANNQPYTVNYASFSSDVQGCARLVKELFVARPYVLEAILNSNYAWDPVFLMSSQSIFGSNRKNPQKGPAQDSINPQGKTYYEAPPNVYFDNFSKALAAINKALKEKPAFNLTPNEDKNALLGWDFKNKVAINQPVDNATIPSDGRPMSTI